MDNNKSITIRLPIFCFPITLRCNLKCKLCGAHSPYYANPYHPTLEELYRQLDSLFQVISHIDKFDIGGGEPLLRVDLAAIMAYLHTKYRKNIGQVRIITNSTVFPIDDKMNGYAFSVEAKKWGDDLFMILDRYSVASSKCDQISDYLKGIGIKHEIRDYASDLHCGGWVDFGDLSLKHDDQEAKQLFDKCAVPRQGFFISVVDGKLFPCGRARILFEKGHGKDFVDLCEEGVSVEMKRKKVLQLLGSDRLATCKYCNGMCNDSKRFLPAEQLN